MSEKTKKTIKRIVDVFLWIFLAFSLIMTVMSISATTGGDGVPSIGGKIILTVQSDSMEPLFYEGDIILCERLTGDAVNDLREQEDVITFYDEDMQQTYKYENILNTHRVNRIFRDADGNVTSIETIGDNQGDKAVKEPDKTLRKTEDIVAKYTGVRIAGLGKVLNFLQAPTGFLLCIVLPLVLFSVYEIVVVVRIGVSVKNKGKRMISASEEEMIKQRAVEEYLKQQAEKEAAQNGDKPEGDKDT